MKLERPFRIKPTRSSLKHFSTALIRPEDIMQISTNVPRIRNEPCSLPPSPWCHRYHDGKTTEENQMQHNEKHEHFRASRRARQTEAAALMEFQGPLWNDGSLCTFFIFLHITFNCFYCCFYGNGFETLWSHYRFSLQLSRGGETDVKSLRLINYKMLHVDKHTDLWILTALEKPWSNANTGEKQLICLRTGWLHKHGMHNLIRS